jgi:putative flippase GtrA
MGSHWPKHRFAKYVFIGGITFAIQVATTSALVIYFDWPPGLAVLFSNSLSLTFHFTMNRRFTFKNKENPQSQVLRYLTTAVFNTLVQSLIFGFLHSQIGTNAFFASFSASVTTLVSGYLLMRIWVFRK